MATSLRCPHCRARVAARPSVAGKPIRCARCDRKFTPPDDEDEPEADDEESPRSRKRRDDDEEAALPRKRKVGRAKRKKKRRGLPKFVLPLAGLALLVVAGVVVYKFVVRPLIKDAKDAGGNPVAAEKQLPDADLLAWAPADSSDVGFVNHRGLAYVQAQRFNPYDNTILVPGGLDPNDFDAAMLAERAGRPEGVYVLRLKVPNAEGIDQAMARLGGRPTQVGKQTVYNSQRYTMYRASDRILVVSDRREHIESRIRSNSSRVELGGSVLEHVSRANADAWGVTVAVGSYRINGFQSLSSMTMLQVREEGTLFTSEITYLGPEIATQAAARERGNGYLEILQNGPHVIYRRAGGTAGGGVGLRKVFWRW